MRRLTKILWLTGFLAGALFTMGQGSAQAQTGLDAIFVDLISVGDVDLDGNPEFCYEVTLASDQEIVVAQDPAPSFTVFDLCGLVDDTQVGPVLLQGAPTFTIEATTALPINPVTGDPFVTPVLGDNPLLNNIRFTFTADVLNPLEVDIILGTFCVEVTGPVQVGALSQIGFATDVDTGEPAANTIVTLGPVCQIPEPGTMALLLPGLAPLGLLLRRRRSS